MRVISTTNASSLTYEGATYEPDPDGVFTFPEPVGVELTTKHASMWVAEDNFNAQAAAAQRDALRDPNFMVTVVAGLLSRVANLEQKLAPSAPAEPEAPEPEQDPAQTGEQPPADESGSEEGAGETASAAEGDGGASQDAEPEAVAAAEEPKKQTAAQKRAAAKKAAAAKAPSEPDPGTGGE